MVEARRLAVHLVGVDGEVEIAVREREAATAGRMLDGEPHDLDIELHHPLDVGGVEDDVTYLGHGSSKYGVSGTAVRRKAAGYRAVPNDAIVSSSARARD